MATVVKTYEPKYLDQFYFPAILQGLWITFRRIFSRKDTIQYPEQKHVPAEGYRGLHRLNQHDNGRIKCVACELCRTACPSHCITIEPSATPWDDGEERYPVKFEIDLLRCIYCGFCEIACPKDAIELTEIYDFGAYTRDNLVIDMEGLRKVAEVTSQTNIYTLQNKGVAVELPLKP